MDAAELDSFHRDGFLAVPGVLSAHTVARMNGIIDEAAQQRQSDAEGTTSRDDHSVGPFYHYFDGQRQPAPTQTTPDRFWFAQLDPCFVQLMAHPAAVDRVRSLCGAAARQPHEVRDEGLKRILGLGLGQLLVAELGLRLRLSG